MRERLARDLIYWRCPFGDALISVRGSALVDLAPVLGIPPFDAYDETLIPFLPDAWLDEAEAAVEYHESTHFVDEWRTF